MKATLKAGISHTQRVHVDKEKTIGMMGDDLRVYSTPDMVSDLEYTCRDLLMAHAESDEDSVGAHVRVDHLGPTLLGMWVDVIVTVTEIEGPRITFDVSVRDAIEEVGRGQHIRFVINKTRQAERLRKKASRAAELN
ncbi:MAG: hotdog domain-containing protein [Pseudomonadota bacterium]|jgi:predicted thioesterase|nr:hotdog domain-containing protein [Pseudomonadota bacterium]